MNVGTINGGSAKNSVSANCEVSIDFRIANKDHIKIIKDEIEYLAKKYDCTINLIEEIKPFIDSSDFIKETKTANFMTEASFIECKNRIILGAGPVTAHEVNEYITEESYKKLVEQYIELIKQVCDYTKYNLAVNINSKVLEAGRIGTRPIHTCLPAKS